MTRPDSIESPNYESFDLVRIMELNADKVPDIGGYILSEDNYNKLKDRLIHKDPSLKDKAFTMNVSGLVVKANPLVPNNRMVVFNTKNEVVGVIDIGEHNAGETEAYSG